MLNLGDLLPDFGPLPAAQGGELASDQVRGAAALCVAFWCNHCPYVQAYEERVKALVAELGPRGLKFLAINSNDDQAYPEDGFAAMQARVRERGFNFPYLRDESQQAARSFGAVRTPHIFLFDAQGRLAYTGRIDDNYAEPGKVKAQELKSAILDLLEGRPVAVPETFAIGCTIKWRK